MRQSSFAPNSGTLAMGIACLLLLATSSVAQLLPGGRTIAGPGQTSGSNEIFLQYPSPDVCVTLQYVSGSPTLCKLFSNGGAEVLSSVTASPGQDAGTCVTFSKVYTIDCFCSGSPPCVANWRVDSRK